MTSQLDKVLTIGEVDAYPKTGKRAGRRNAANGEFPTLKCGEEWLFRLGDLRRWAGNREGKNLVNAGEGEE